MNISYAVFARNHKASGVYKDVRHHRRSLKERNMIRKKDESRKV
jgi:hypothetical protein